MERRVAARAALQLAPQPTLRDLPDDPEERVGRECCSRARSLASEQFVSQFRLRDAGSQNAVTAQRANLERRAGSDLLF